mmetsp:Transcript_17991/g.51087  ORF Transcript_17991/g.51087 Transcript_17991/m.51087 type:complete len:367 (+) Transcript_17991:709-1809(+)
MITLGLMEFRLLHIGLGLLFFWPVERILDAQHGSDGQDLLRASQIDGEDEHLGEVGFERELRHLATQSREKALFVKGSKRVQGFQRPDQGCHRRRVHEIKPEQVVDSHRLQLQHDVSKIGSLDLGDVGWQHLRFERLFGVKAVALSGAGTSSTAGTLPGGCLTDGRYHQGVHAQLCVEGFLLAKSRVDDVVNSIDRQGGLCDVRGNDALSRTFRSRLEDSGLHFRRKRRVHGQHDQFGSHVAQGLHARVQRFAASVDFFLSSEEDEDVALRFRQVDLHHGDHAGVQIVTLRFLRVQDFYRECPSRNRENGALEEVAGELFSVQGGGRHDDLQIGPSSAQVLQQPEQDVSVNRTLVGFVKHQCRVPR